jgi:hypothetical protein
MIVEEAQLCVIVEKVELWAAAPRTSGRCCGIWHQL